MLAERPRLELRFLWCQALKPDGYPWQKGNAAMNLRALRELQPNGNLLELEP